MPTLHNPTSQDLYSHVIGDLVPAGGSVEITDEQAARVNTATGIWQVTAPAARVVGKRGGKVVEQSAAPRMEKR